MQLNNLLPAALLLASTATATTFNNFRDISCQVWNQSYVEVTKAALEKVVQNGYATARFTESNASGYFFTPEERKKCPPNSDNNFKWVCS